MAVPPRDDPQPGHGFGACTADLEALADGLAAWSMTTVALESTGVSWIPLFELLETRGFEVLLADPPPVRQLKGRPQRDGHDGQWWPRRHTFGRLAGAFRPVDHVGVLRSDRRQRTMRLTSARQHMQHRQKALTQMHLKRPHVVSALTGVTGMAIEGIDDTTALMVVSAMGLDMGPWPTVKHFTSWLGVCPHEQVSGGQGLSRRTKPSAHRVATALRLAASCLHHRRSALGAFFRRMKARLGTPKAITATAHQLARLIDSMLKHGTADVAHRMDEDEPRYHARVVAHLTRRAHEWGYTLIKTPEGAPA